MEEFVFASHTSVVSKQLLYEELRKNGIDTGSGSTGKGSSKGGELNAEKDSIEIRAERILAKKKKRPMTLEVKFDSGLPEGSIPLKRVKLEALDFDWLFDGDNAQTLLRLLATEANNQCLTKKSIKIFVDLMWTKFQPAIIKCVFMPYVIYLMCLSQLAAGVTRKFIELSQL